MKGEVETAFYDRSYFASLPILNKNTPVIINNKTFTIENVKKKNKAFVFRLKNIDNIEEAQKLIGFDMFVNSSYLPLLDNDTFYEAELIGYEVIDSDNNLYGKIVNVYNLPSNYVFEIKLKDNNIVSVPFVHAYFAEADKENRNIKIIQKPLFDD